MTLEDSRATIRAYHDDYRRRDLPAIASVLGDEFRFSSPMMAFDTPQQHMAARARFVPFVTNCEMISELYADGEATSRRLASGRRLCSSADVLKLQQILTLRYRWACGRSMRARPLFQGDAVRARRACAWRAGSARPARGVRSPGRPGRCQRRVDA
jgi:hypothetical protein